ncbi:MAG: bifunctional diaminohydroxyphosphoribosylaminopyrimidine deaminase/5-amino-6-(5-phosphoribosylamino)uracil reductase RibD [Polyangiaceae bacterium]
MNEAERDLDVRLMRHAIAEARRARPSPRPPAAALLVGHDGEVIAAAHRADATQDSPELAAIEAAGELPEGSSLVLTIEPPNEEDSGSVDAILKAGIKRVLIGAIDPNPEAVGGAATRLKEAGLSVEVGVAGGEARALIAAWHKVVTQGLPQVALKLALSLDGRIATRTGDSKWVTGPEARVKVQQLRAHCDAIAVGIGTALSDDPRLTVRDDALLVGGRAPSRVVFDTKLRLPTNARVVETAREVPTWILAGADAPQDAEQILVDAGCEVMRIAMTAEGRVDVGAALQQLAAKGVLRVLIEGGAELAGSLLAGCLADELHGFVAPILLGPRGRPGAVDWAGPDKPADAPRIVDPSWEVCGKDAYVHGRVAYPES